MEIDLSNILNYSYLKEGDSYSPKLPLRQSWTISDGSPPALASYFNSRANWFSGENGHLKLDNKPTSSPFLIPKD
ncbi:MAG: hypothetical protein ACTSRG_03155 [Candidatus Helarchaeota archaeon]